MVVSITDAGNKIYTFKKNPKNNESPIHTYKFEQPEMAMAFKFVLFSLIGRFPNMCVLFPVVKNSSTVI